MSGLFRPRSEVIRAIMREGVSCLSTGAGLRVSSLTTARWYRPGSAGTALQEKVGSAAGGLQKRSGLDSGWRERFKGAACGHAARVNRKLTRAASTDDWRADDERVSGHSPQLRAVRAAGGARRAALTRARRHEPIGRRHPTTTATWIDKRFFQSARTALHDA